MQAQLRRNVQETAAGTTKPEGPSATQRLRELRDRIRDRELEGCSSSSTAVISRISREDAVDGYLGASEIDKKIASVTAVDWRANQLADSLAKVGATEYFERRAATKTLKPASRAIVHSAALLGQITHAANNHVAHPLHQNLSPIPH